MCGVKIHNFLEQCGYNLMNLVQREALDILTPSNSNLHFAVSALRCGLFKNKDVLPWQAALSLKPL